MKYAIISDIHSNIQALNTALEIIEKDKIHRIICLGDIVGYNAKPSECIKAIKSNPKVLFVAQGNHDEDVSVEGYRWGHLSRDAYDGMMYSQSVISKEDKEWLKSLKLDCLIPNAKMPFWVSHYSPKICTEHGYILNSMDASAAIYTLKHLKRSNLFFFGHTHIPTYVKSLDGKLTFDMGKHLEDDTYVIDPDAFYLINPGSIGQPRSGITSYAVLDTKDKTVSIKKLEYDFELAKKDVLDAGYSLTIANRLDPSYDPYKVQKQIQKERYKRYN